MRRFSITVPTVESSVDSNCADEDLHDFTDVTDLEPEIDAGDLLRLQLDIGLRESAEPLISTLTSYEPASSDWKL